LSGPHEIRHRHWVWGGSIASTSRRIDQV
jgi:hypothetical protein